MKKKVFSWLLTIASYMFIIFDRLFVSAGGLIYNFFVTGFAVFKNIDIVFLIIYLIVFAVSIVSAVIFNIVVMLIKRLIKSIKSRKAENIEIAN